MNKAKELKWHCNVSWNSQINKKEKEKEKEKRELRNTKKEETL